MSANKSEPDPKSIKFHYIKGSNFRVVSVDGVIGGVTPAGRIHFATFAERMAIPKEEVFALNPDGSLGNLVPGSCEGREGIVREMEVDLVMSLDVAKMLRRWLDDKIGVLEKMSRASARKG